MNNSPFAKSTLEELLKVDGSGFRLQSRENSCLEFKQSFNWNSKAMYAKTMAAFANSRGGYIVFGVKNKPREIIGLVNANFDDQDPALVTGYLNTALSPELRWEMNIKQIRGKTIGLIYTFESLCKPIVCMRNDGQELKEADIYYRYRGRSEKIRYSELRVLLEEGREKERLLWMKHIEKIATVGVGNVGIFDPATGFVSGPSGSFIISEDLLPQLSFIKEGHFVESGGAPVLKLVGQVQPFSGNVQVVQGKQASKAIRSSDLVYAFLRKEAVADPFEYVKAICFENAGYYPIYYFLYLGKVSLSEARTKLLAIESRARGKVSLLKRIGGYEQLVHGSLTADTDAASEKRRFLALIKQKKVPTKLTNDELEDLLGAVTHVKIKGFEWDYLVTLHDNCSTFLHDICVG